MKKTMRMLVARAAALLGPGSPDAADDREPEERYGDLAQATALVFAPLCALAGMAYAVHDILAASSPAPGLPTAVLVLPSLAAGLALASFLFAVDRKLVRFLVGGRSVMSRAAVVVPRLLLAAGTAFVISVPLTVTMFEERIGKVLIAGGGGAATGGGLAAESLTFVEKAAALERLATEDREIGLLILGILAVLALILANPVLVTLLADRTSTRGTTSGPSAE